MRVSVLTPTHNRSEKLRRLFNSLERSTYKDFEWVIVNDGSTDDTEAVVKDFISRAKFPITYFYQINSGKHVALNHLYDLAQGEYCFQIDDDDELLPDAMEKGLAIWDGMSVEERKKCWCVCGRHILKKTNQIFGEPFPENINCLSKRKQNRILNSISGDKCGMQRVDFVSQFKLPELKGCNFFPEIYLWRQLDCKYSQIYTNEAFGLCHSQIDEGLMNHDQSRDSYLKRFLIYKYLLSEKCECRSRLLSKVYFVELYCFHVFADNAKIGELERYKGIRVFNVIALIGARLPILFYRVLKKKMVSR